MLVPRSLRFVEAALNATGYFFNRPAVGIFPLIPRAQRVHVITWQSNIPHQVIPGDVFEGA